MGNLIQNGIMHSPEGGELDIYIGISQDSYIFQVRDRGPGIPEDMTESIFDEFVQVGKSVRGLGLGLSIAKYMVLLHKGNIQASNKEDGGSCFTVTLPAPDISKHKTILIVDDSPAFRNLFSAIFKKRKDIRVIARENGVEALRYLEEHPEEVELVVLDMDMPVMGGLETLRNIRNIFKELPVIIITGIGDEITAWQGGTMGANGYLTKPCPTEKIIEAVDKILGK